MAGDWIKMRTRLVDERAVMTICDQTGLDEFAVIGRLHSIWSWAGEHTTNGEILDVTTRTIDRLARHLGFAKAMIAAKWLEEIDSGIKFPKWDKYNSRAAKERSQAAKRQADKRWRDRNAVGKNNCQVPQPGSESRNTVTSHDPRREESIGSERSKEVSTIERTDRPIGHRPPIEIDATPASEHEPRGEPLDVSGVDWDLVVQRAEALAKRVPPFSNDDRRQWFKYAVMVEVGMFAENWLFDAADAVLNAREHRKSRQAHLVAILKSKAAEVGTDNSTFRGILKRIEIPIDVWKRNVMKAQK